MGNHPSMQPTWTSAGSLRVVLLGLASGGVCLAAASPRRRCALTAPFHLCLCARGRHRPCVSVALSRGFPRVGVTHRPCPVVSGLSSRDTSPAIALTRSDDVRAAERSCQATNPWRQAAWQRERALQPRTRRTHAIGGFRRAHRISPRLAPALSSARSRRPRSRRRGASARRRPGSRRRRRCAAPRGCRRRPPRASARRRRPGPDCCGGRGAAAGVAASMSRTAPAQTLRKTPMTLPSTCASRETIGV